MHNVLTPNAYKGEVKELERLPCRNEFKGEGKNLNISHKKITYQIRSKLIRQEKVQLISQKIFKKKSCSNCPKYSYQVDL